MSMNTLSEFGTTFCGHKISVRVEPQSLSISIEGHVLILAVTVAITKAEAEKLATPLRYSTHGLHWHIPDGYEKDGHYVALQHIHEGVVLKSSYVGRGLNLSLANQTIIGPSCMPHS
jgi:hypothetical protein